MKFLLEQWPNIVSIILSGLISLIISAIYFHKGNRNNLQMSVIFPMISLLKESRTEDNFYKLNNMATSYLCKYLTKREKHILTKLVLAYKEVAFFDNDAASASAVLSYLEDTLKKYGMNLKSIPVQYQGVIVDYDYPEDIYYLEDAVQKEINKYDVERDIDELETRVSILLSNFTNSYFSNNKIPFFEDCGIYKVIHNSKEMQKRKDNKKLLQVCRTDFLNLKICKNISTGLVLKDID